MFVAQLFISNYWRTNDCGGAGGGGMDGKRNDFSFLTLHRSFIENFLQFLPKVLGKGFTKGMCNFAKLMKK